MSDPLETSGGTCQHTVQAEITRNDDDTYSVAFDGDPEQANTVLGCQLALMHVGDHQAMLPQVGLVAWPRGEEDAPPRAHDQTGQLPE